MRYRIETFFVVEAENEAGARVAFLSALQSITSGKDGYTAVLPTNGKRLRYYMIPSDDGKPIIINITET